MRSAILALAGALVLAGCEGDEKKLERLKLAQATAQLQVYHYEQNIAGLNKPAVPNAEDSLRAARTRLEVAQRDLNKFMNGR